MDTGGLEALTGGTRNGSGVIDPADPDPEYAGAE
jgi:hypothetical protein